MEKLFKKIMETPVSFSEIPEFDQTGDFRGIKAITYDALDLDGKKTKVFAYLGYPQIIKDKAPAVVLVHGGGGVAYPEWVKMWNDRGYVALAMSTEGDFPTKSDKWNHGLCGIFKEVGYTDAPANDQLQNSEKPIEKQWMYHAVGQVILANNILRADSRVDIEKIGLVGISWGSVITAITIGYDNRFAFAVPIYGSGYMLESKGRLTRYFKSGKNPDLWLAEKNFEKVNIPVLWLCYNHDTCFSVNSNSKSYIDTVKNNEDTRLSIVHKMYHDHPWAWIRKEPFAFADFVCMGKKRLPTFKKNSDKFEVINPDNVKIPFLKLYYMDEPYSYSEDFKPEQEWKIIDIDCKAGTSDYTEYEYEIPKNAKAYYLEATTLMYTDIYITCSEFVEL